MFPAIRAPVQGWNFEPSSPARNSSANSSNPLRSRLMDFVSSLPSPGATSTTSSFFMSSFLSRPPSQQVNQTANLVSPPTSTNTDISDLEPPAKRLCVQSSDNLSTHEFRSSFFPAIKLASTSNPPTANSENKDSTPTHQASSILNSLQRPLFQLPLLSSQNTFQHLRTTPSTPPKQAIRPLLEPIRAKPFEHLSTKLWDCEENLTTLLVTQSNEDNSEATTDYVHREPDSFVNATADQPVTSHPYPLQVELSGFAALANQSSNVSTQYNTNIVQSTILEVDQKATITPLIMTHSNRPAIEPTLTSLNNAIEPPIFRLPSSIKELCDMATVKDNRFITTNCLTEPIPPSIIQPDIHVPDTPNTHLESRLQDINKNDNYQYQAGAILFFGITMNIPKEICHVVADGLSKRTDRRKRIVFEE